MTSMLDLAPPARHLAALVRATTDDQLSVRTPCESYTVGDLLDHLMGLTVEFRNAATKTTRVAGDGTGPGTPSSAHLDPDWRRQLPVQLDDLAAAWRDPAAWEGTTAAGGIELPAPVAGMVAVDELVMHGWDLAVSTGQPFECDEASVQASFDFASMSAAPGQEADREGLFGPVVEVPADAPLLHRALGLAGRDPSWSPS
jgi:uncharacterized protein (TIGR03086 family)